MNPKTPGRIAYEQSSDQFLAGNWEKLDKPTKRRWENIAAAVLEVHPIIDEDMIKRTSQAGSKVLLVMSTEETRVILKAALNR